MIHPDVAERLNKARELNRRKLEIESKYRKAKRGEKYFFAQLLTKEKAERGIGPNMKPVSIAELEYRVYAMPEWQAFADALSAIEAEYNWIENELELQKSGAIGEMSGAKYSRFEEGA